MHHQRRHPQLIEQLDSTGLCQNRHDLALRAFRVERPVIGRSRLLQQHRTLITHLGTAQGCQQVSLLLDRHLPAWRTAPCQQLHQRGVRCRQTCRPRTRHDQCQAAHPIRCHRCQVLGDHPAHAHPQYVELAYAECVHQAQAVVGHVGQRVGCGDGQTDLVAQQFDRQVGRRRELVPTRKPDIAVVVANNPKALATQRLDHIVRPVDQLPAQAHHQQQGRIPRGTDALIDQAQLTQLGPLHGHLAVAALVGKAHRYAGAEKQKKP
ncbi:hypothetical protein D3C81_697660 [compost metagenome]